MHDAHVVKEQGGEADSEPDDSVCNCCPESGWSIRVCRYICARYVSYSCIHATLFQQVHVHPTASWQIQHAQPGLRSNTCCFISHSEAWSNLRQSTSLETDRGRQVLYKRSQHGQAAVAGRADIANSRNIRLLQGCDRGLHCDA